MLMTPGSIHLNMLTSLSFSKLVKLWAWTILYILPNYIDIQAKCFHLLEFVRKSKNLILSGCEIFSLGHIYVK